MNTKTYLPICAVSLIGCLLLMTSGPVSAQIVANDVRCVGCVGSIDIKDATIRSRDISAGAVDANAIGSGAVDWEKLAADLQDRILQLEATVAALESTLADNTVLKLDGYLDLDSTDPARPTARFAGVNVQVVNGLGESDSVNGLGNLLVGYDEDYTGITLICSDGRWASQAECEANGGLWSSNHKSGSHNLVIGSGHRYSQQGGLITGVNNAVNRHLGNVIGGEHNLVSGIGASVISGLENTAEAEGKDSALVGGDRNIARGGFTVVVGGSYNFATGHMSVVSGGSENYAAGPLSTASGGSRNYAADSYTVVTGGRLNEAIGQYSTVSGGDQNEAIGWWSSVNGGSHNEAIGQDSTVNGGSSNTASGNGSVVGGGYLREASGTRDWVAGELWQDQ